MMTKICKYSHFESYLEFGLTRVDQINSGTKIHVVCPTLPTPCLLMLWRLQEPEHQQAWYWPPEPGYSISSIRRVKTSLFGPSHDENQCWFIGPLRTNFSEIWIKAEWLSFREMSPNGTWWRPWNSTSKIKLTNKLWYKINQKHFILEHNN